MKKFKKIYVEITNKCNLNCSFCGINKKEAREMTQEEFKIVLEKIKPYTDYIYLHVKGEPLLHSNLDEILSLCDHNKMKVNITTNGVFLKERLELLLNHPSICMINVSLHSENNKKNYLEDIFSSCKILSTKMFISYRLWDLNDLKLSKKSTKIVEKIISFYNLETETVEKLYNDKNIKIDNNTFVNKDNLFVWPDVNNGYDIEGFCYGLKTHIGILSDGTVVPCCLDGNGEIALGNIFKGNLKEIIESPLYKEIEEGFKNNKSVNILCKNCNFRKRFNKM